MSEKLPIAIEAIKAGNKQLGQQLLAQILQADPNNEHAWLWMSAVVDEDKRKYCIERVLRINPNNVIAIQALSQLNQEKKSPKTQNEHSTSIPEPSSPSISQKKEKQINFEDVQKPSIVLTVTKDGFKMGLIGGVLGIIFAYIFRFWFDSPLLAAVIIFATCISANVTSGIIFFRRGIGANLSVSFGGFVSGFVSGAITSLGYGVVSLVAPILIYLAFCGLFTPFLFAVLGSIIIWIPRVFIDPNKLHTPLSIPILNQYYAKKEGVSKNVVTIKDIPLSTSGEKYWLNLEQDKNNAILFLSQKLIYGTILKSASDFDKIISKGIIINELFKDCITLPYDEISELTLQGSEIFIQGLQYKDKTAIHLDCENNQHASYFLEILQEKLGAKFEKSITPVDIKKEIKVPGKFLIGTILCSSFLYFLLGSLSLTQVNALLGKELGDRVIDFLLFLIAEGGIFLVGGGISILLIGTMAYRVFNAFETITLKVKESASEKIQRAINHIKIGEIENGQKLLNLALKDEPNNETAWLWISHIATASKKVFYLEKVLEINPNNQEALKEIQNIKQEEKVKQEKLIEKEELLKNITHPAIHENPAKPKEAQKFWVSATRTKVFIFSLTESELLIASGPIGSLQKIKNSILQSESPEQFLTDKENIPYKNITKVRQILSTIRIYYMNGSQETSRALDCEDAKMAGEIVDFLRKHLRSQFDETNKPIGTGTSLFTSGFIMLVVLAGTAFFYYGAYELEAGIISPRGSARTRALLNLLDLLGTNGVLVIGAILFLLSLGLMFYLIKNPPTVTEFIKKNEQKKEEAAPRIPSQPEFPKNAVLSKPEEIIPLTPQVKTGAVLIDGLLSGLILGGIGIILPGISIFTNDQQLARSGMYLDGLLILFSGVLTGILFQGRNIGKNQSIVLGGTIAGALTGLLAGMALGLSPQNRTITNMATQDGPKIYMMVCMIYPSIGGAIIGALSAWLFGLTSKEAKVTKNDDPLVQTTLIAQPNTSSSQNDTVGSRFAKMFTRRLVLAAIFVAIIFICTFCQSLTSSL